MRIRIREAGGSFAAQEQTLHLRPNTTVIVGRSELCDIKIGASLDDWNRGIGRIQATIVVDPEGRAVLIDGTRDRRSKNGVFYRGELIPERIELEPGMKPITLFSSGIKSVDLIVEADDAPSGDANGTYPGDTLMSLLQVQVDAMEGQVKAMASQVQALHDQLQQREKIDAEQSGLIAAQAAIATQQTQLIDQLQKQIRKAITGVLVAGAVAAFGFGVLGSVTEEGRAEWRKAAIDTTQKVILGLLLSGGALYLNKKENDPK